MRQAVLNIASVQEANAKLIEMACAAMN